MNAKIMGKCMMKTACLHCLKVALLRYILTAKGKTVTLQWRNKADISSTNRSKLASLVMQWPSHASRYNAKTRTHHFHGSLLKMQNLNLAVTKYLINPNWEIFSKLLDSASQRCQVTKDKTRKQNWETLQDQKKKQRNRKTKYSILDLILGQKKVISEIIRDKWIRSGDY